MKKVLFILFAALMPAMVFGQEICDNGIDDDGDGLIDMNDSDCRCAGIGVMTGVTSLIPNPSFEDTLCCPTTFTQLDCSVSWIQASEATSDYFNTCGFTSISGFTPSFPLPGNGSGYAGFYNFPGYQEMIGACLISPMKADTNYRFSFFLAKGSSIAPSFMVSIYGTPDCNDLPWQGSGCPVGIGSWVLLGETSVSFGDNSWHHISIEFTPSQDIRALAIGGSCANIPAGFIQNYYYIDELIVASSSQFDDKITVQESGKWCTGDLRLQAEVDTSGGSWQWYRDGIALSGETLGELNLMSYGTGFKYTAVYSLGDDCVSIDHMVDTTDPANRPRTLTIYNNDTAVCEGTLIPVHAQATPGYHYQWFPTTGLSDSQSLTPDLTAGADTTIFYTLTASYPGCPDTSGGFRVGMESYPSVELGNDTIVCPGDLVPLSAMLSPYRPDYSYDWSPDAGLLFDQAANNFFPADSAITYRLTVSTPVGCSGSDSVRIEVETDSFAEVIADTSYCLPNAIELWATGGDSYLWEPAYGLDDPAVANPLASPATPTRYTVHVTNHFGCRDSKEVFVDVYPNAVIHLPDTITIYPGERHQIRPGSNAHYFEWFPNSGISDTRIADPYVYPEVRTRYFVTARTEQGCTTMDSIDVEVKGTILDLPNAFHPGGGNRVFKVEKRGIAQLNRFVIYNRWGTKVFETTDVNQGWDGTYRDVAQPLGVYVYLVDAVTDGGEQVIKKGNVTLMR